MFKNRGITQETAITAYEAGKASPSYDDDLKKPVGEYAETTDQAAEQGHAATDA